MNNIERFRELASFSRSFRFFNGCRVLFTDDRTQQVKFGVIFNYEPEDDEVNILCDGDATVIAKAPKVNVYRYDGWLTHKPVSDISKINMRLLEDAEKSPLPPTYFNRKLPIKWDLPLCRAVWIWGEAEIFPKIEGKRMQMPKLFITKEEGYLGIWYLKNRSLGMSPKNTELRFFTCVMLHEMMHQYNSEVQRNFNAGHGPDFMEHMDVVSKLSGISVPHLEKDYDSAVMNDGGHLQDKHGLKHDIFKRSTKKFFIIVTYNKASPGKLKAVRVTDDMKGMELTSVLNNHDYPACLYDAPFVALEFFNAATRFDTKFTNALKAINGVHLQIISEQGKRISPTRDVVADFIDEHPDYKKLGMDEIN